MPGKISRLPQAIRDELNRRLTGPDTGQTLCSWLNSLPEVQAFLAAEFPGQPITEQNLSEYRKRGFRQWQMRQAALQFASDESAALSPSAQVPAPPLVDHLVHWIATRFAAAAHSAPLPEDPEADLRDIRKFLTDIVLLRRGDLSARRLALEQQRLDLERDRSQTELEELFWKWTKRPDIQAKLYPHRDPDKARRDAIRLLDEHLLGVKYDHDPLQPEPDPACFI